MEGTETGEVATEPCDSQCVADKAAAYSHLSEAHWGASFFLRNMTASHPHYRELLTVSSGGVGACSPLAYSGTADRHHTNTFFWSADQASAHLGQMHTHGTPAQKQALFLYVHDTGGASEQVLAALDSVPASQHAFDDWSFVNVT